MNINLHTIILIILCHLIGDYVLQCDFVAQTKGKNWYHLFIHCASIFDGIWLDMAVSSNFYFAFNY